jgi:uncharacterized protein HemX
MLKTTGIMLGALVVLGLGIYYWNIQTEDERRASQQAELQRWQEEERQRKLTEAEQEQKTEAEKAQRAALPADIGSALSGQPFVRNPDAAPNSVSR